MVSTLGSCSKLKLVHDFWPYAKKAARNAAFKWDIDEDDTFQVIMLDAWTRIDWALSCEVPIAALRKQIRFSVGHEVTARYWRRGRGETDQFSEGFDPPCDGSGDVSVAIDVRSALDRLPIRDRAAILAVNYGYTMKSLAELSGLAEATMQGCYHAAVKRFKDEIDGVPHVVKGDSFSLIDECGNVATGIISEVAKLTGLSRGSISNLRTGKRSEVRGWRLQ